MQAFAALFERLDQTTSTNEKIEIMAEFFRRQDAETGAWALFFLSGRKPKQLVGSAKLRQWAQDLARLPDWLIDECYAAVGDTAEMVALMLAAAGYGRQATDSLSVLSLGAWMETRLLPLAGLDDESRRHWIIVWCQELQPKEIFILNKLLTGSLRIGVSETLVYRALAAALSLPTTVVASRLMGIGDRRPSSFSVFRNLRTKRKQPLRGMVFCCRCRFVWRLHWIKTFPNWGQSRIGSANGSGTASAVKR